MSLKALNEVAENYFSTLNPIAERISEDIEAIREAYEDLWRCLSQRERDQIINETVIFPEAILKYALGTDSEAGYDLASLNVLYGLPKITGSKYIVDESTGLSWRDEHSGPFSWKTPSQIDLSIFGSKSSSENDPDVLYSSKINKTCKEFSSPKKIWGNGVANCEESKQKTHAEKNGFKKHMETPDSPNVVLGGTCSKISGLCSKLKFLPGKSFSYEVKTVVTPTNNANDVNILEKIRASAVNKIQNTIKLVGGKAEKKVAEVDESENLVNGKEAVTIVRLQKPSPRVNKPKSPPPPPPSLKPLQKSEEPSKKLNQIYENDSENTGLLQDNSEHSLPSVDQDSATFDVQSKVARELSGDINSMSTECTPLSGPSFDNIPKSGFDFLDNCISSDKVDNSHHVQETEIG